MIQTYNNIYEVTINSTNHGERIYIVAAYILEDLWEAINTVAGPWLDDTDLTIALKRLPVEMFIAVTDTAYGRSK